MKNIKAYTKYKNSGIEWIGEIPEGWIVRKLKSFSKVETGTTPPKSDISNYNTHGVPWIKPDNLKEFTKLINSKEKISLSGLKFCRLIPENSILICGIGTVGKMGISGCKLVTNQQINSIIFDDNLINLNFGKYLIFSSKNECIKHSNKSVVLILNKNKQENIIYPIPSIQEQTSIANFLDYKTSLINSFINKKHKIIKLLQEQKQAIISQAVTQGIDKNAKMKNSGIEWLGDVPDGWEVKKLKYVSKCIFSNVDKHSYENQKSVKLCNYTDVYKNDYILDNMQFMHSTASDHEISKFKLSKNDVVITKDSETANDIAMPALVKQDLNNVICGYHLAIIRGFHNILSGSYLFRLLMCKKINHQFEINAKGVTRVGLGISDLKNSLVIIPPLPQQSQIVEYIESKTAKIDIAITKIKQELELVEEYKQAL